MERNLPSSERDENRTIKFREPEHFSLDDLNDSMDGRSSPESNHAVQNLSQCSKESDVLHSLSGIYAEVLIVITAASILTEILPGSLPLFYFHDYLFLYLFGMGITIFIVTLSIKFHQGLSVKFEESANKLSSTPQKRTGARHMSDVNIYFKVGTVVFGCVVIITSLMEIISVFISPNKCISQMSAAQPVLRCIFLLFQIYFLRNPKEILDTLGCVKNLALMHLFATNMAIWIRTLLWECAKDWEGAVHIKHNSSVLWDKNELNITVHSLESNQNAANKSERYPNHVVHYTANCWWRVQKSEEIDVTSVQYCIQNSTIGLIWERTEQFLFTFKTQYYFLIVCILYIMWCNCNKGFSKRSYSLSSCNSRRKSDFCSRATKGFCLGFMIFFTSIVICIIFFSVDRDLNMMYNIIFCVIFGSSSFSAILGLFQVKKMLSWKSSNEVQFIRLFQSVGLLALFIYGSCNVIAGSLLQQKQNFLLAFEAVSMILHGTAQYLLIVQVSKKKVDVSNVSEKPGRQVVVFLIFCNISLWILECFVTWSHRRHQYSLTSGTMWPVVTRCVLPFVVFYRYHSVVTLVQAWVKTYRQV